jgi:MFS family permease
MSTPASDSPSIASSIPIQEMAPVIPKATVDREPRGYRVKYFAASVGIFLALFAPALGGLSVKIQSLVPLDQASTQLGLVMGSGAFFALVAQPLAGRVSDRTTARAGMRKPWILVGIVGTFFSLLAIPFAPNIPVLILAWCAAQLFSNFAQAALTATVADQVPEQRRGRVSGLIGATAPIGILTGALGLSLLPTDLLRIGVPAVFGLVAGLVFALTLKDRVLETPPGRFDVKTFLASFVFNPATHRDLGWAWLTKAMVVFGYASVVSYLTLFLASEFGMTNPADQLRFTMWATIVMVVFNVLFAFLGGAMSDRVGKRRVFITIGGLVIAAGVLLLAFAPVFGATAGLAAILVAEALMGIGAGLFISVDMALCIAVLPNPEDTAKDLGVLNIANTLPQMVAPFIAGVAIIPLGNALFDGGYALWFAFAATVAVIGSVLVYRIKGVR